MSEEYRPRPVEPIPCGSLASPRTYWAVPHLATTLVDEPFSGWMHVYADARVRAVALDEFAEDEPLEPDEARALARALVLAADHAEGHYATVGQVLTELRDRLSPLMGDQPNEAKVAAHDAVRTAQNAAHRDRMAAVEQQAQRATAAATRTR